MRRARIWHTLAAAIALGAGAHALRYGQRVDDAFIAFRYAENFAAGRGLVFNPGERVEGYTDFLWVILLAGAHRLGFGVPAAASALGIAAEVAVVWIGYFAARSLFGLPPIVTLAVSAAIGASSAFAFWAGAGLETSLFSLLSTAAVTAVLFERREEPRRFPWSPVLFGLATLTRPEGVFLFVAAWVADAAFGLQRRRHGIAVAVFLGIVGAHTAFRMAYYGYPLPNTYYAKAVGGAAAWREGWRYVAGFAWTHGLLWLSLALAGALALDRARRRSHTVVLAVLAVATLGIIAVGGDSYPLWRFCVPYWPLLVLAIAAGAYEAARRWMPRYAQATAIVVAVVLAGSSAVFPVRHDRRRLEAVREATRGLSQLGRLLAQREPSTATIAISSIGCVPYYSGLRTIDMLGLADEHIAHARPRYEAGSVGHRKFDSPYVIDRRPDLLIIDFGFPEAEPGASASRLRTDDVVHLVTLVSSWPALVDVLHLREFRRHYAPEMLPLGTGLVVYVFRWTDELTAAESAIPLDLAEAKPQASLARLYERFGMPDDALGRFQRALELDRTPSRRLDTVSPLIALGRFDEALTTLDVVESEGASELRILDLRGQAFDRAGRLEDARVMWAKLADRAPNPDARRYYQRRLQVTASGNR